jgi:hypothetical protein
MSEVVHAGMRGAVAAMAMSGMREFTVHTGLVEQTPPQAIANQRRVKGVIKKVPRKRRRAALEFAHWSYGVVGGAVFGALPKVVRDTPWTGPVYGLAVWAGFELGIAPALGLKQAYQVRPVERLALAADHLLYGFVLDQMRRQPKDEE